MKKRSKRKMQVIIGVLLLIIGIITVFFNISYSKTRAEFSELTGSLLNEVPNESGVFTEEDIVDLPLPVQKYFRYCGYIGTPKMSFMKASYQDVDFVFGKDKPTIKIDYIQYNIANKPARVAYIDSSKYGIPFEGLDSYTAGKGSMRGVLAKLFILFNQTGEAMDKASLVTFLSECLIIPNSAIQDYITWEDIDALHAKATISYYGRTAGGIFAFNQNGEMCSFTTDDREATATDGTSEKVKWSVVFSEYEETKGIKKPTGFQAIWHYDDGDLLYFDGKDVVLEYNPNPNE
ncbi:MAG: hypothetical protein PHS83_02740 [Clostridia bacterium]|nr:hypothetical protein [Clostridia bacterium]